MAPTTASDILALLANRQVTHVIGIPDNGSAALFDRLESQSEIEHVIVTREGEAFGVAAGLWIGGMRPVVVIQNTGLLESGDALRGTVCRMGIPLVMLVGFRGFEKMSAAGLDGPDVEYPPEAWIRPDVDSIALLTEPTLRAWAIPSRHQAWSDEPTRIREAFEEVERTSHPAAVLLTGALD